MSRFRILLAVSFLAGSLSSALHAQCSNTTITGAFQLALGRVPTATECNTSRYAGGAFTSTTDLVPLVKASVVCSDPWVAQAYYQLGYAINNHSAIQTDPAGPNSTVGQCNYANYGSWSSFADLKTLVQAYRNTGQPISAVQAASILAGAKTGASGVPASPLPAVARPTITGPASIAGSANGAQISVTWSNGAAAAADCSSGLQLQASGGVFGTNYGLVNVPSSSVSAGTVSFVIGKGLTASQAITMHLYDGCHSTVVSNDFPATITVTPTITIRGLNTTGCLIDTNGNPLPGTRFCGLYLVSSAGVFAPGSYPASLLGATFTPTAAANASGVVSYAGYPVRIVGPSAGTFQVIAGPNVVAAGGGNIVAAGGGNVVAAGGGNVVNTNGSNVVAAGGGNIILNGGGNLQFVDPVTAARQMGLIYNNVSVISNDGGSFQATTANLSNIAKLLGNYASKVVSSGPVTPPTTGLQNTALTNTSLSPNYSLQSVSTNQAAAITGPSVWTYGQPATVTWTVKSNLACASGVHVLVNGATISGTPSVALTAGRSTVPWTNLARGSSPSLTLACGTAAYSPSVSTRIQ